MKKLFIMFLAAAISFQLFSYSLLERVSGNLIENPDARSSAMGGAAVSGGNRLFDAFVNPANLGMMKEGFGIQTSLGIMKNDDNRSLPMYNFFDGYIDDATYVSNVNYYSEYSFGLNYKHSFGKIGLSAAGFYRPLIDLNSYYEEEVRTDTGSDYNLYPPIIAKNFIEGEGGINSLGFIASFNYKKLGAIGLEFSKLSGDAKLTSRIAWSDYANESVVDDLPDTSLVIKRKFDDFGLKIGGNLNLGPRISLGFSYAPKVEFAVDVSGSVNGANPDTLFYKYVYDENNAVIDSMMYSDYLSDKYSAYTVPSRFRIGFSFQPRNMMKTFFNCDLELINWSDVNNFYNDEFNYYIGVEHKLSYNLPLRMGFRYETEYHLIENAEMIVADKISTPTFTAGTGFSFLNHFRVDISAEYSHRKYETLDLFPDGLYNYAELWSNIVPQSRGWENPDEVSESLMKLTTTVSFKW